MKHISMLNLRAEYEYMKQDIDSAITKCLEHQRWILGPEVKELEDKIAAYLGVTNCIGVSSGTDALVLSLRALAFKLKGKEYFERTDEIITTPFTFVATGDAILRSGATPVFVDINPITFNIDPVKIQEYLQKNAAKVIGVIPVHLYGQSCDMNGITQIAKKYNLFILEDAAQAFGGTWNGEKLGSLGAAGAFSFFPSKNLGGFGDAGMVATNDDEIAALVRMLLKHGGKDKYNAEHIGYNSRLDTLQAAILVAKIKYLDEFNEKRRYCAQLYHKELSSLLGVIIPKEAENAYHVYHQYTLRIRNGKRDNLQGFLKERNISTMVYYPLPLHKMKVFENKSINFTPLNQAEKAAEEVLSLPIEPLMPKDEIEYVTQAIKDWLRSL